MLEPLVGLRVEVPPLEGVVCRHRLSTARVQGPLIGPQDQRLIHRNVLQEILPKSPRKRALQKASLAAALFIEQFIESTVGRRNVEGLPGVEARVGGELVRVVGRDVGRRRLVGVSEGKVGHPLLVLAH